ncbi:actin-regulating kinase Prk1p [[Candida] railenensis]|uniref:non-specific serine/threonine protein kinase n=1 Tax=[Candida] railenensis TaxID=45579 RepID=A0A9P0QSV6_9ASCO|nr:actin-regulating kinase Prk1p [[Candida] railenensis]
MPVPPPNAYTPNTKLTVGSHKVSITKFIGEGGFAHVYTCMIDPPFRGSSIACLKRVQVPSKIQLNLLRQEVDAMKRLKGNKCIVSYIDSHAARLDQNNNAMSKSTSSLSSINNSAPSSQQYEVFLLMEYCSRNGLIDFMNTRLTHKLQEPEILQIMRDITTGVAMCHHLQPPLIHRDIKIENVLIDHDGTYKLCDFGSAVPYQPVPKTPQESATLHNDIMQYTTPQYRSPEMIELSRGFPIDDKSDVWALGCLLYKLCYYTTPFESPQHQSLQDMEKVILHADSTLKLPHDQPGSIFSPRLKNMIKCTLREDPRRRPSAVQLLGEICAMLNQPVPDVIPSAVKHHIKNGAPLIAVPPRLNDNKANSAPQLSQKVPPSVKPKDPFATIDKSKFLAPQQASYKSSLPKSHSPSPLNSHFPAPRPKSTYLGSTASPPGSRKPSFENYHRYSTSTSSLKEFVQMQIEESSSHVSTLRKSEEGNDRGTLEFLRSKQENQNTGGSISMSFKNGLRKISTGGIGSNGTGGSISSVTDKHHYRRSSVTSLKSLLTGGSSRKVSNSGFTGDNHVEQSKNNSSAGEADLPVRKMSIKKRMAMLLNNSDKESSGVSRTAEGYGKYTDTRKTNPTDDLDAINSPVTPFSSSSSSDEEEPLKITKSRSPARAHVKPKPPVFPQQLNKPEKKLVPHLKPSSLKVPQQKAVPSASSATKKKPPPKPKKPIYLKAGSGERRLSNASDLSIPDIDDLEKDFTKRFPSKVL